MNTRMNIPIARWVLAWAGLAALIGGLWPPAALRAQTPSGVSGLGTAAVVNTLGAKQQIASATLPAEGGLMDTSLDAVTLVGTLEASALSSITSGMMDLDRSSAQTTAEAADVNILNGLIVAQQVVAVASSYVGGGTAASDAAGSSLLGLRVAGVSLGDVTPAPNTRMNLPGVGYAILNEQVVTGDGLTSSGITVNMIHVVLQDALTGFKTGEITVGSARSAVGS